MNFTLVHLAKKVPLEVTTTFAIQFSAALPKRVYKVPAGQDSGCKTNSGNIRKEAFSKCFIVIMIYMLD